MTAVIAFAAVDFCYRQKGIRRVIVTGVSAIVIVISGSYIYSNPYFEKAENIYHVPQSVVEICDAIEVEGREVMALFPKEMLQYVRQYSPVVCMPYGREITVDRWNYWLELYDLMEAEVIRSERLCELARIHTCAYIILPEEKPVDGSLNDYDYETFGAVPGYVIYKDSRVNLEIQ